MERTWLSVCVGAANVEVSCGRALLLFFFFPYSFLLFSFLLKLPSAGILAVITVCLRSLMDV